VDPRRGKLKKIRALLAKKRTMRRKNGSEREKGNLSARTKALK